MIQHGYEMDFTSQRFGMIIYGAPGIGKTTLALSDGFGGANTLLLDVERGVGRVNAVHRMNASVLTAGTYEELLEDLHSQEARAVNTIVVDTCGAMVDLIKDWAFRTKPEARTKEGTWNNMKGHGFVKSEIEGITRYIKTVLNKNVIFHSEEKADKDGNPIQRLRCEGSFKNTVWTGIDFGCYVQMLGGKRVACFSPQDDFFAKGCHGIEGQIVIPDLKPGQPNDFVAKLFAKARANMQAEQDALAPDLEQYTKAMDEVRDIIAQVADPMTATAAAKYIPTMTHALTSKAEASAMLKEKTKSLGLQWSREADMYIGISEVK